MWSLPSPTTTTFGEIGNDITKVQRFKKVKSADSPGDTWPRTKRAITINVQVKMNVPASTFIRMTSAVFSVVYVTVPNQEVANKIARLIILIFYEN